MDNGLLIYLLFVVGIIPLALLITQWRKIVNPVIHLLYEIAIVFRKQEYLPPRISIEGMGIKRNLKTVEALFLAQKSLQIILGVLLSKAIETGTLRMVSRDPLRMETDKILPDTMNKHEREFVRICVEDTPKKRQDKLAHFLIRMIKTVSNQMRGFSLPETVDYYRSTIDLASEKASVDSIQNILNELVEDMDELIKTVTKATNPFKEAPVFKEVPEYLRRRHYRGSGSGSGGRLGGGGGGCACAGCACACACAGCACACAGGGR